MRRASALSNRLTLHIHARFLPPFLLPSPLSARSRFAVFDPAFGSEAQARREAQTRREYHSPKQTRMSAPPICRTDPLPASFHLSKCVAGTPASPAFLTIARWATQASQLQELDPFRASNF